MKKIILTTAFLGFFLSIQAENELTFAKTNEYIDSIDYNNSVKHEMRQYLSLSKQMTINADGQNLEAGLQAIRLTDCLIKHTSPSHFKVFQESMLDEIKSLDYEEDYKHGINNAMGWWLTTIAMKLKLEGGDPNQFKELFSCNSTKIIPMSNNISSVKKPKAPTLKSYDDPIINFYLNEYKKAYKGFIQAKSMVDIFRFDVEKDLSMNCIRRSIKLNGNDKWIEEGSKIRKAIRYELTPTNALRKSARKNEDHMGRNFYLYELNTVNHIQDDITDLWANSNMSSCMEKQSSSELYEKFLLKYVKKYTEDLTSSRQRPTKELEKHYVEKDKWLKQITESCNDCKPYRTYEERLISKKSEGEKRLFKMAKKLESYSELYHLVNTDKANINSIDSEGRTPLFYAIRSNNINLVKSFLKAGADIMHKDKFGKTIFDDFDNIPYSIKTVLWHEEERLYGKNWQCDKTKDKLVHFYASCTMKSTWSELMHAINDKDQYKIDELLKKDIDLEVRNNNYVSALHTAVYHNDLQTMEKLLKMGVNIEAKTRYNMTPIFYAIHNGNKDAVNMLIKYGARLDVKLPNGVSPLFYAFPNKKSMIDLLLQHGISIDEPGRSKRTLLIKAVLEKKFKDVKFLLDRGADIDIKDNQKKCAYDYVSINTSEKVVKILEVAYRKKYPNHKGTIDFVEEYKKKKDKKRLTPPEQALKDGKNEKFIVYLKLGKKTEISNEEKN